MDPKYIENWFLAVWGYNSGIYPMVGSGQPYGVGWLNNPANPMYPSDREHFLRGDSGDASHPSDWPYEEKVMGWIENPQESVAAPLGDYAQPIYGPANHDVGLLAEPTLPDWHFCGGSGQACTPDTSDPCPNDDSTCWWHGNTTWADCSQECATENLTYAPGSPEPAIIRSYVPDCSPLTVSGHTVTVVDDMKNSSLNLLGCAGRPQGGKFTLRLGSPSGDGWYSDSPPDVFEWHFYYSYYGEIDLHQLGAGYLGHTWFTHTYPPPEPINGQPNDGNYHKVVASWTPDLPTTAPTTYTILAHVPSHGGAAYAHYLISTGAGKPLDEKECDMWQDTDGLDEWFSLGSYSLTPGVAVQLGNVDDSSADGSEDIAFDAVAFVSGSSSIACGRVYSNG
jgi:hypothetical protein